jgi:hypothetical protein
MHIYRLSLFFTPVSFRWTIPLRVYITVGTRILLLIDKIREETS